MLHENDNKNNQRNSEENTSLRPDPGTRHTTDPQENMEGPVSSTTKGTGRAFDTDETKQEADEIKEERI